MLTDSVFHFLDFIFEISIIKGGLFFFPLEIFISFLDSFKVFSESINFAMIFLDLFFVVMELIPFDEIQLTFQFWNFL